MPPRKKESNQVTESTNPPLTQGPDPVSEASVVRVPLAPTPEQLLGQETPQDSEIQRVLAKIQSRENMKKSLKARLKRSDVLAWFRMNLGNLGAPRSSVWPEGSWARTTESFQDMVQNETYIDLVVDFAMSCQMFWSVERLFRYVVLLAGWYCMASEVVNHAALQHAMQMPGRNPARDLVTTYKSAVPTPDPEE